MTTLSATAKAITIFEGPDGAGKSTMAQEFAKVTGALYIHHGPYKQVGDGLSRIFVESMLPALLGYQDVVLDRCWVSEPIYAGAYRDGKDRVGKERSRLLDRLAMRCGAVVVKCLPPWAHVKSCFNGRLGDEYLDNEGQLLQVYGEYQRDLNTHLHEVEYDYTHYLGRQLSLVAMTSLRPMVEMQRFKNPVHDSIVKSSGNWLAKVVIVGENFGEHKNNDPMHQSPFGSFSGNGCSLWLARHLDEADISEQSLLWINADEIERVPDFVSWHEGKRFIALGEKAYNTLIKSGARDVVTIPHPQYWKRFHAGLPYSLAAKIKEAFNGTRPN